MWRRNSAEPRERPSRLLKVAGPAQWQRDRLSGIPGPHVARTLAAPRVVNIADLRRLAKRRLPRVVFDYIDGGAESEVTLRENCRVFDQVTFRPRGAVAIPECDLRTRVLSADLAFPAILA